MELFKHLYNGIYVDIMETTMHVIPKYILKTNNAFSRLVGYGRHISISTVNHLLTYSIPFPLIPTTSADLSIYRYYVTEPANLEEHYIHLRSLTELFINTHPTFQLALS